MSSFCLCYALLKTLTDSRAKYIPSFFQSVTKRGHTWPIADEIFKNAWVELSGLGSFCLCYNTIHFSKAQKVDGAKYIPTILKSDHSFEILDSVYTHLRLKGQITILIFTVVLIWVRRPFSVYLHRYHLEICFQVQHFNWNNWVLYFISFYFVDIFQLKLKAMQKTSFRWLIIAWES